MKEQLISFETAKLAKEKGFQYTTDDNLYYNDNSYLNKLEFSEEDIPAPTQSLLQKWLREVHNIDIQISLNTVNVQEKIYYSASIYQNRKVEEINIKCHHLKLNTYEEALERGLQAGLKLISNEF